MGTRAQGSRQGPGVEAWWVGWGVAGCRRCCERVWRLVEPTEAPRRRSLRSLGSERKPATLRSHRPRRAGSATLKHTNQRRYR